MWHPDRQLKKRTIVLFLAVAPGILATACSAPPRRLAVTEPCPPTAMQVCEAFGPQNRCRCASTQAIGRELGRLGTALPTVFASW